MMRILHAPANIGNQPWVLSRYERQLGVASDLLSTYRTSFAYAADRVLTRVEDFESDLIAVVRQCIQGAGFSGR